jgi:uncharacterized protein (DUF983 family)
LTTKASSLAPFLAGARGRCPNCAQAPLFAGFLTVTPRCPACGFDLAASDSGDGPAVFVILVVGFIAVFGAMFTEIAYHPPVWLTLAVWIPLAGVMSLALLRPMKGLMIAAHIRHRAGVDPRP